MLMREGGRKGGERGREGEREIRHCNVPLSAVMSTLPILIPFSEFSAHSARDSHVLVNCLQAGHQGA